MGAEIDRYDGLQRRIGYRFTEPRLLAEALTHPSATRPEGTRGGGRGRRHDAGSQHQRSYERLEFLGDRVLGLAIADILIQRFPTESEGALSRRHAALVRRETLAEVAAELDLGACLTLARGEEEGGGRTNPAILADACEALIGAVYRDGGLAPAEAFVRRHWAETLGTMGAPPRDPKTALQEWAQRRSPELPTYEVIEVTGPSHAPTFAVAVHLGGLTPVVGRGASKRAAEQAAAAKLLEAVGAVTTEENPLG